MKNKIFLLIIGIYVIVIVNGNDDYDYDSESFYNDSDDNNNEITSKIKEDAYLEKLRIQEKERNRNIDNNSNNHNLHSQGYNKNDYGNVNNRNNPYIKNKGNRDYKHQDSDFNQNFNNENRIYNEYLGIRTNNNGPRIGINDEIDNERFNGINGVGINDMEGLNNNFKNRRTNQFKNTNENNFNQNNMHINNNNNNNQNSSYFNFLSSFSEYLSLIFVFGFIYRCLFMRNNNDNSIKRWYEINKNIFKDNFSYESFYEYNEEENRLIEKIISFEDNEINEENNSNNKVAKYPILKRSQTVFEYKVSNDDEDESSIREMIVSLEFKKNQDYLFLVTQFLFNYKDLIKYEMVVDYSIDYPSIFIIGNEKEVGYILSQNNEFNSVCKEKYSITSINKNKVCACEDKDLVNVIFGDSEIAKTIKIINQIITLIMFVEAPGSKK